MPLSTQNLAQQHTVNKLNHLLNALQEIKRKYEEFASGIKNTQLHQTIIGLAVENNQYASELIGLIQSLGGYTEMSDGKEQKKTVKKVKEQNVLSVCQRTERKLVNIYKEVLDESYVYDSLKKIIGNQLNGVMCTFHKLKLLSKLQS